MRTRTPFTIAILTTMLITLAAPGAFGARLAEATKRNVLVDEKDERAVVLLNEFMQALLIEDFDSAAEAVFPLTHKSNYNSDHTALSRDLLDFSFKKAHTHAKFYAAPVVITRVQELKTTEIGHPDYGTYEKGIERKYWVAKKIGINGMPAPLVVFFPADGGDPKISYMGSL